MLKHASISWQTKLDVLNSINNKNTCLTRGYKQWGCFGVKILDFASRLHGNRNIVAQFLVIFPAIK